MSSSSSSLLFLLCFHLLICFSCGLVSGTPCFGNQSSLLLMLKQGFSFPGTPRLGSWVARSDCCLWEGVTCDDTTGHVIGLDLTPSSFDVYSQPQDLIVGHIDPNLFQLHSLQSLNLSYINYYVLEDIEPIPYGLERLTNLTHLNLSHAKFSGQILLQITHLSRLVSLDLSSYYDSELEMPNLKTFLHNLTALQQLYLDKHDFSKARNKWSQIISSSLPRLKVLSLSGCGLSGPIDASLLQLPFLSELHLSDNYLLSLTTNSFSNTSSIRLRFLDLSWCELELGQDQLLERIFRLPNLHTLHLSGNKLPSSKYFPFVPPNNNVPLQFLGLRATSLTTPLPKSIFNLKFLNHLDLSFNQLTGGIPKKLGDLRFLNHLDLSYNQLTGAIPEKLGDLKFLNHLGLSSNQLTGAIPEKLGDLMFLNHMDLSYNNLTGAIPKTIGNLELLSLLHISDNYLTCDIPLSFGLLLNLTQLSLTNNMLNGTIPSFLFNLPSLQKLYLSQNHFHGPLSEFTNLSSSSLLILDLSSNKLNGPIPSSISYLDQLEVINLSSNNFSGTVDMRWFHKFMNLSALDFSSNSVTVEFNNGTIDNTPLLSQLEALILSSCNMREFPWFFLHKQTKLSLLDLSNNGIHGTIPNWIWQFKNLMYLNLSHNLLTSIEQPNNLTFDLHTLDLHANMLEGSLPIPNSAFFLDYSINRFASIIPTNIGDHLYNTFFLSLSKNKFVGEIPPTICSSGSLEVLDMSNNSLSGSIPRCLTNMTTLSIVSLRGNDLKGNIPDTFVDGSYLRTLDLNSNRLSGSIPKSLLNCTKLEVLDLGNNYLNGTFPFWLENFPHLQVLVLRSNQFHGMINPNQTRQGFQRLRIIDISTNKFTGNLPVKYLQSWKFMMEGVHTEQDSFEDQFLRFEDMYPTVTTIADFELPNTYTIYYQDVVALTSKGREMTFMKILTIFTSIDLSNNKFHGRIPEELGNLKFLIVLNLSRNNLDGQIPTSLGNLSSIESMDLSHNNLSGEIPTNLTGLYFLEVLDLSHNRLTGRIPKGTQFSTFSNTSFEGNPGLCGPPLSSNCTKTPTEDVEPTIPPTGIDDEVMNRQEIIVGGIVGFFCGMALVIWPLLFWRRWRRWYYSHVDKVLLWTYICISHRRG